MLALLTTLARARGWTRTRYAWLAPDSISPVVLLDDGWRHLTVRGHYARAPSEAAALARTVLVPSAMGGFVLWSCLVVAFTLWALAWVLG
jgi:hypothetical protein